MAREKKKAPAPIRGVRAVTRRAKLDRALQQDNAWRALNPLKAPPKVKHKTTFELVENADKKKKQLEFKITTDIHPPPGFEFVPIGHPKLTQACKDLSRDQDAMIFIVSNSTNPENLDHHMNRVGYHFRGIIVDQARMALEQDGQLSHIVQAGHGVPEPIPETQEEINRQADAVLRDLFPRIPNIDRKEIIQHSFQKGGKFHGESKVGMASGLTLARRVQLAAIAYIRHTHTRYDELLKKTSWLNARKAVEKPCLDIIVKWRGDEETGRDQLDEILREVIEISDTEEESEDDISNGEPASAERASVMPAAALLGNTSELHDMQPASHPSPSQAHRRDPTVPGVLSSTRQKAIAKAEKRSARKTQRFRRYAAAAEALAGSSHQSGRANEPGVVPTDPVPMDLTMSPGPARSVYHSREPTVMVTRGTPIIEQMPRHVELRTDSQRLNSDPRRERMATVVRGLPEGNAYTPPQPIHDPEGHRPKVGYPSTGYSYQQVPVSPIRHSLQDMLLQSIEPASPASAQAPSRDASHILHREPRYLEEAPRIISRGDYEPMSSAPRFQSPRDVIHGNELGTKRHRVADHSAGDFDTYPGSSIIPVNYQGRGEDPRREPVRYFSDRPISSFEGVNQHQSWPVPSDRMAQYHDDTSIRGRANPVVTDDAFRRPHQVVEVQRPNEGYQAAPFTREEMIRDVPVRRDTRFQDVQDSPRIVYIREAPLRPRSSHDHFSAPTNYPSRGLTTYEEHNSHRRTPAAGFRQHVVVDSPPDHEHRDYRDPSHSHRFGREPVVWPGSASRDVQIIDSEHGTPEVRYTSARHGLHERSNPLPISESSLGRRQTYRHELTEPIMAEPLQTHYRHEHQTYVTPSIDGNYIESHGPPLQYHVPEPQRIVWVDR